MKRIWHVLGAYVAHLSIGALMYLALMVFGGTLHRLEQWARPLVDDERFTRVMSWVESLILLSDAALVVWWSLYSTCLAIKELLRERFR